MLSGPIGVTTHDVRTGERFSVMVTGNITAQPEHKEYKSQYTVNGYIAGEDIEHDSMVGINYDDGKCYSMGKIGDIIPPEYRPKRKMGPAIDIRAKRVDDGTEDEDGETPNKTS